MQVSAIVVCGGYQIASVGICEMGPDPLDCDYKLVPESGLLESCKLLITYGCSAVQRQKC